jgi:hypothetical protein
VITQECEGAHIAAVLGGSRSITIIMLASQMWVFCTPRATACLRKDRWFFSLTGQAWRKGPAP